MIYNQIMQNVIKVDQLVKNFPAPRQLVKKGIKTYQAVKGISFSVSKGEIFGILGPNGAGKTTTLEILEGLKKPTSGKLEVLGLDVKKEADQVKRRIGVQLQSSDYLPLLTLAELIELFASFYGAKVDPLELLGFVGLADRSFEQVKNLSGGQKQRFTIATSLVNKPEIIFLDEPTTGLDPRARRDLWKLIREINSKGITVVMTTHYMEEAEYLCNRVAIMDGGKILKIDDPKTLIDNLAHTTQISFFTDTQISEETWKEIPAIEKIYSNYPKVVLEITSLDSISDVVKLLREKNISFSGFTVRTASLEDVYLDLTGKEFEG